MFFNPTISIRSRVMDVVSQRISDAQAVFDNKCHTLDEECEAVMVAAENDCADKKEALANELVTSILGR